MLNSVIVEIYTKPKRVELGINLAEHYHCLNMFEQKTAARLQSDIWLLVGDQIFHA